MKGRQDAREDKIAAAGGKSHRLLLWSIAALEIRNKWVSRDVTAGTLQKSKVPIGHIEDFELQKRRCRKTY